MESSGYRKSFYEKKDVKNTLFIIFWVSFINRQFLWYKILIKLTLIFVDRSKRGGNKSLWQIRILILIFKIIFSLNLTSIQKLYVPFNKLINFYFTITFLLRRFMSFYYIIKKSWKYLPEAVERNTCNLFHMQFF